MIRFYFTKQILPFLFLPSIYLYFVHKTEAECRYKGNYNE